MSIAVDNQGAGHPTLQGSLWPRSLRSLISGLTPAQHFLGVSLLILVSGMAVVGWWVSAQVERGMLNRAGYTTALYVDSFVANPVQELVESAPPSSEAVARLEQLLAGTKLGQEVVAFKVWSPDGTVIYSADPALIGRSFPIGDSLRQSLEGTVTAELSELDDAENFRERVQADRLLEIYSPIRSDGTGEVIASVEYYQRVDDLERLIAISQQRSWLTVLVVTLVMYLLLWGFVRRASATIVDQRVELQAQVSRLQELLARNVELDERVRRAAARSTAYNERVLRRISSELHDGPAQYIGLASLRLDRVLAACEGLPDATRVSEDVEAIQGALSQAMLEVRAISAGLGLPQLDKLALGDVALKAVRAHERRTNSTVELVVATPPDLACCSASKITVYRVIQEGLTNAFRHARGAQQRVELELSQNQIALRVSDTGPGFEPPLTGEWGEHMGLAGMRDRVESLGGEFAILSQPGSTVLRALIPLHVSQEGL